RDSLSPRYRRHPTPPLFPYTTLFRSCISATSPPQRGHLPTTSWEGLNKYSVPLIGKSSENKKSACHSHKENGKRRLLGFVFSFRDRKSTRLNSSHVSISYAVFCLKKK